MNSKSVSLLNKQMVLLADFTPNPFLYSFSVNVKSQIKVCLSCDLPWAKSKYKSILLCLFSISWVLCMSKISNEWFRDLVFVSFLSRTLKSNRFSFSLCDWKSRFILMWTNLHKSCECKPKGQLTWNWVNPIKYSKILNTRIVFLCKDQLGKAKQKRGVLYANMHVRT